MSLFASHLRFAVDLKEKYRIKDIQKYLSGTVYPDSRYLTGISRELTHPLDFSTWQFDFCDDFKKGWLIHLNVDQVQEKLIREKFPQIFVGKIFYGSKAWIGHTAIKALLDLNDCRKFNISDYLSLLEYAENPNNEDLELIKKYNQIFIKVYHDPKNITIKNWALIWQELGVNNELIAAIVKQFKLMYQDEKVRQTVDELYFHTLTILNSL